MIWKWNCSFIQMNPYLSFLFGSVLSNNLFICNFLNQMWKWADYKIIWLVYKVIKKWWHYLNIDVVHRFRISLFDSFLLEEKSAVLAVLAASLLPQSSSSAAALQYWGRFSVVVTHQVLSHFIKNSNTPSTQALTKLLATFLTQKFLGLRV